MKRCTFKTKCWLLLTLLVLLPLPIWAQSAWQTASTLTAGEQKAGTMGGATNEQWYKVEMADDGEARFECMASSGSSLTFYYMYLYSSKGAEVEERNSLYCNNVGGVLTVSDLAAGTYYLRLVRSGGTGAYHVHYTAKASPRVGDAEPNNGFGTATTVLANGVETTGRLGYFYQSGAADRDVEDWYRVEVKRNVQARFGFRSDNTLSIYYLRLYYANGKEVTERNNRYCNNMADTLVVDNLAAGTYYLRIDRSGGQGSYALRYDEIPPRLDNDTEPNDTYQGQGVVTLPDGQPLTGHLGYGYTGGRTDLDTEDWYKVVVAKNGTGRFSFETEGPLSIYYLRLYSLKDGVVKERNAKYCNDRKDELIVPNLEAGTYYLRIDRSGDQGAYRLTYTAIDNPVKNDTEPNNRFADPGVVTMLNGMPVTGQLGYTLEGSDDRDVEDWYRIDIKRNTKVAFGFKSDESLRIYYLRLYNATGDDIAERNNRYCNNMADTLVVHDLAAGTYYLRIDRSDGQGAYTLSYTETPPTRADDAEPNNGFSKATATLVPDADQTGHLGYYYVAGAADRDVEDWYKVDIDRNTKASLGFKSDESLRIYYLRLYSATGDTVAERNSRYCNNMADTLVIDDLAAGTYYLRIDRSDGQGSYTIGYTETPPTRADDAEPNNGFSKATVTLAPGADQTGHLGYYYVAGAADRDVEDWYRIEITGNVQARFGFKSDETLAAYYLRLYNETGDTIAERNSRYCNNMADTLVIDDLAAGTYYLRIDRSYGQGAYSLGYTVTKPVWANDAEPDDNFHAATTVLGTEDGVTGHLGYYYKSGADDRDVEDWYKVETQLLQTAKFGFRTDGVLSVYYLRLYEEDGDTIRERNAHYCNNTADTLVVNDLPAGTYYLRVDRAYNQGAYTLGRAEYPLPIADFEAIRDMKTYSLVNNTRFGGDKYTWDFGDGETSTQANPVHAYKEPGVYNVSLKAVNAYGTNTLTKKVQVRGLQRIESDRGGAGGQTTAMIYGGDIKEHSTAYLRTADGKELEASYNHLDDVGELQATFDLASATEGVCDVIVRTAGEPDMLLEKAFTVEPMKAAEMWTEIQGRDRALIGRWQTYSLEYGNKGNVDSEARILWLVTPDSPAEIEFLNVKTNDLSFYPKSTHELLSSEDMHEYLLIDTVIDGQLRQLRVYSLMIPILKANSHERIEFRVKSEQLFELGTFITESFGTINTTIPSQRRPRIMAASEYNSFEDCSGAAFAKFVAEKGLGLALDAIPGASCVVDAVKGVGGTAYDAYKGELSLGSLTMTVASTAWTCAKDFLPPLKAYKMTVAIVDAVIDMKNGYDAVKECEKYRKKKDKRKRIRTVTSFDPNEMIGPAGFGTSRFVERQAMPYTILFENKKTAAVPAQEVVVLDTLDTSKFDMSTFRFNSFGFGGKQFKVVQDGNNFVNNIDLRPSKNAILRVSGVLNPDNGVVRWQFITLDPATMDLTEDPDGGFLPPNANQQEGEGFVSFIVSPKNTVKSGDRLDNCANIFFDTNKPIMTNTWSNTIDEESPTSRVVAAEGAQAEEGGGVVLEFEDSDGMGAGAKFYDLYVASGNGSFERKLTNLPVGKKVRVALPAGDYKFYSLATDSIGHQESMKSEADLSYVVTGVSGVQTDANRLTLHYNSTTDHLMMGGVGENVSVRIYDVTGCLVLETVPTEGVIELSRLTRGIYIVMAGDRKGRFVKR